jgi:hypothetical protein
MSRPRESARHIYAITAKKLIKVTIGTPSNHFGDALYL